MKTIAIYHSKGGVGKTAAAVNLAYLAAAAGLPTLLCDLDAQGAATFYFRIQPKFRKGASGFVKGGAHWERNIKATDYPNLDLLPADFSFRSLDANFDTRKKPRKRLGKAIRSLKSTYQYVFLDCPPNLSLVSENIFHAADRVLIPLVPTPLALRSFEQILAFFGNQGLPSAKLFPFFSMVEKRKTLHREMMAHIHARFPDMLKIVIPYRSEVEKMGLVRAPLAVAFPRSPATLAFRKLWEALQTGMREA